MERRAQRQARRFRKFALEVKRQQTNTRKSRLDNVLEKTVEKLHVEREEEDWLWER